MKRFFFISLLVLWILNNSCAFKVPVLRMRPATFEVAGISRLGIQASTETLASQEALQDFSKKVQDTLKWRGFFKEVSLVETPEENVQGLDAVLKIDAKQLNVAIQSGIEKVERLEETGKKVQEVYYEQGEQKVREVPETVKKIYEIPYVQKEAVVSLLVDFKPLKFGKPGQISLDDRAQTKVVGQAQIREIVSNKELLLDVSNPMVSRLVDYLVPHLEAEKIKLANHSACQGGVQLVKQGDWQGALESWRAVVQSDPANHAAHYNMGVAYEGLKNYSSSLSSYQKALKYSSRRMYQKAVERLKNVLEEDARLQKQLKGRSL